MKFRGVPLLLCVLLAIANVNLAPAMAASYTLSLTVRQTPSSTEPTVTLYGQIKPVTKAQKVVIEVETNKKWHGTALTTSTTSSGTWKVEAVATALNATVKYRAVVTVGTKHIYSSARSVKVQQIPEMSSADPSALISESGPGGRIHGMDISKWQHPANASIAETRIWSVYLPRVAKSDRAARTEAPRPSTRSRGPSCFSVVNYMKGKGGDVLPSRPVIKP